MIVIQLVK